ncbi:zinc-ribbon domain-containing protein [Pelagibacteraceae bacterium]|nr:zinc-ribbon domain-containing protein [Pelagibacteraceae bacterium]MDC0937758.1 zinc-ribbon domain-containing protein [Pelagibacteraceae bacterium]
MILSCNSCEKKFVVPDQAITATGRTVQCGSCGNKWKQFPINNKINKLAAYKKNKIQKVIKENKPNKKVKKTREINLYSPEYLEKKHGISINDVSTHDKKEKSSSTQRVTFGFYNTLILFFVTIITFSKGLHFFQDLIVQKFPFTQFYLDYFFESIRNIFVIWRNLISSY